MTNNNYQYFKTSYEKIIFDALNMLKTDTEWETRYSKYLTKLCNINKPILKAKINRPIYAYTTISKETKTTLLVDLRYQGQSIATLSENNGIKLLTPSKNNLKTFSDYEIKCPNLVKANSPVDWHSNEAREFRNFFTKILPEKSKHIEHTLESALLSHLENEDGKSKPLKNIQPIKFYGKRIQLPTPLTASKAKNGILSYAAQYGGGIDIAARRKDDTNKTYVTVIELKDENLSSEPPEKAIQQAITYAVFIRELIRSKTANTVNNPRIPIENKKSWYNFLGFKGNPPKVLTIKTVIVMPNIDKIKMQSIIDYCGNLKIDSSNADSLELHFISVDTNVPITDPNFGKPLYWSKNF